LGNFNDGTGRVWPSEPKNNRETRDIVEKLTQEELKLIIVSTSQIDFGVVFIKSESTKKFSVKNNTAKFILVEMQIYHEELRKSGNKKQVIPPKETAVFHIVLESKTSGDFKATVKYSINSNHSF
jgi:NADPH-dependent 7-cyano-7-deazaguanine reductase QueF